MHSAFHIYGNLWLRADLCFYSLVVELFFYKDKSLKKREKCEIVDLCQRKVYKVYSRGFYSPKTSIDSTHRRLFFLLYHCYTVLSKSSTAKTIMNVTRWKLRPSFSKSPLGSHGCWNPSQLLLGDGELHPVQVSCRDCFTTACLAYRSQEFPDIRSFEFCPKETGTFKTDLF